MLLTARGSLYPVGLVERSTRLVESICGIGVHVMAESSSQDFIKVSKAGMDEGAFIMHRCHGASTDINESVTRAVTKMKATITQRFDLDGCVVDAESDCRFCFFWEKGVVLGDGAADAVPLGEWRARFVRHW